jgi:hypothetical protein
MKYRKVFFLFFLFLISANILFAQKNKEISFEEQNKKAKYYSFSFGMGINYGDNKSLKSYIEGQLPFYNEVPVNDKLSDFATGIEFFGGAELQLSKKLALKGEYAYFFKSYNSTYSNGYQSYSNYDFSYYNHQPFLTLYYLIPQQSSFIKIGAGAGFLASTFTEKAFGNEVGSYTSTGIGIKLDAVLDLQMGKNLAGYLGGYINKSFQGDLKKSDGSMLLNKDGGTVNLNSFGLGIRAGLEFFFFKI